MRKVQMASIGFMAAYLMVHSAFAADVVLNTFKPGLKTYIVQSDELPSEAAEAVATYTIRAAVEQNNEGFKELSYALGVSLSSDLDTPKKKRLKEANFYDAEGNRIGTLIRPQKIIPGESDLSFQDADHFSLSGEIPFPSPGTHLIQAKISPGQRSDSITVAVPPACFNLYTPLAWLNNTVIIIYEIIPLKGYTISTNTHVGVTVTSEQGEEIFLGTDDVYANPWTKVYLLHFTVPKDTYTKIQQSTMTTFEVDDGSPKVKAAIQYFTPF